MDKYHSLSAFLRDEYSGQADRLPIQTPPCTTHACIQLCFELQQSDDVHNQADNIGNAQPETAAADIQMSGNQTMTQPHKVTICLTGDTQSIVAVQRALMQLDIEGLTFDIHIPRTARKSDSFDMLTYGTITLARERELGAHEDDASDGST
jgi:hypothetical protein